MELPELKGRWNDVLDELEATDPEAENYD